MKNCQNWFSWQKYRQTDIQTYRQRVSYRTFPFGGSKIVGTVLEKINKGPILGQEHDLIGPKKGEAMHQTTWGFHPTWGFHHLIDVHFHCLWSWFPLGISGPDWFYRTYPSRVQNGRKPTVSIRLVTNLDKDLKNSKHFQVSRVLVLNSLSNFSPEEAR